MPVAFGTEDLGQSMPELFPRSFGAGEGFRDDAGLMRIMAGDAGEPALFIEGQDDAVLALQLAHANLEFQGGFDKVRFAGGVLVAHVVAALTKHSQAADHLDGRKSRAGFIRLLRVAKEAFFRNDFSRFIQLVVGIQPRVLLRLMTAETEGGAVRVGGAAQGGDVRILLGAKDRESMAGNAGNLAVVNRECLLVFGAHRFREGDIGGMAQVPGSIVMATAAGSEIALKTDLGREGAVRSGFMAERTVLGLMVDVDRIGQIRQGGGNGNGFGRAAGGGE